jgi:3',5'-cyclic AMP phosphodiesterase CpdA
MRQGFADHGYLPRGGFLNYVIDEHPIRIVALDSIDVGSPMGVVCDARLAWLDSALASAPEKPTVLAMHHPPFVVAADHPFAFQDHANADALSDVVSRHRQVVRVLCGHVHRPRQVPWGGTIGSTSPCVAGDLRKGPMLEGLDGRPVDGSPVYDAHTVHASGRIDTALQIVNVS